MKEKTTKTPQADQRSGSSKDQAKVADEVKQRDTSVNVSATSDTTPSSPDSKGRDKGGQTDSSQVSKVGAGSNKAPEKEPTTSTSPKPNQAGAGSSAAKKTTPGQADTSSATSEARPSKGGAGGAGTPPPKDSTRSSKQPSSTPIIVLVVLVIVLAAALAYHYWNSEQQIAYLESQSRASTDQARQAEQKAQEALDALGRQGETLSNLQRELRDSREELDGLNMAFQTITDRGSDLVLLNDIDHLVMIAQQQLQLNGNVANAIISLESAQAQLARANRPALASLQQTINGDLERLRAATTVDIALLSARLDELAGLLTQAPLLVPDTTNVEEETPSIEADRKQESDASVARSNDHPWWERAIADSWDWTSEAFDSLRDELGQFISVRRVDDAAALLISPDQAARFRDSLRQRIMTAQLALMMNQPLIWETETDALLRAIESRFDMASSVTRQAVRIARDVADTAIDTPLPDVSNSIQALETIHEQMGRRAVSGSLPGVTQQTKDDGGQASEESQRQEEPKSDTPAGPSTSLLDDRNNGADAAGSQDENGQGTPDNTGHETEDVPVDNAGVEQG